MSDNKDRFLSILRTNVQRDGLEELIKWLESTDFFTAPASTKFHSAYKEGLLVHSLNVYDILKARNDRDGNIESGESVALVALLHDVCKAGFYKESTRNVKNEQTGQWEKVPYYQVEDRFPYGHGEKSVYLIERFLRLKPAEAIAIRWHMGSFDDAVRAGGYTLSHAFEKYPLAVKLHLADLEATYLLENDS
ncbi:MAG: HD domain-containing protein [Oscillospiraceae bacterium]|nr:HD domain-containing protein [Oscillospiraceae bacterium]